MEEQTIKDTRSVETEKTTMEGTPLTPYATVQTLDLPRSDFKRTTGFSIDFGSSVIKIAYALDVDDKIRLHLASYPRERIDEAFQHINNSIESHIKPGQHVFLTGIGGNQHKELIETELKIQFTLLMEFGCHIAGFLYLMNNFTAEDILAESPSTVMDFAHSSASFSHQLISNFLKQCNMVPSKMYTVPLLEVEKMSGFEEKIEFPALVFMLGSAGLVFLVNEDGTFEAFGALYVCGRTLLANGSMLAECKTFEELINLAEKGDHTKLSPTAGDVINTDQEDAYSKNLVGKQGVSQQLGHAVGKDKDEFSREDRAAAVVNYSAMNLASQLQMWAMFFKAKHAYFIGGVPSSQLMREQLAKYFMFYGLRSYNGVYTKPHFSKLGAYLGVIGALLRNLKEP